MIIDNANYPLSERFIKELHRVLKNGTTDRRKEWFAVGDYKRKPNEVARTNPPQHLKMYPLKWKHLYPSITNFNISLARSLFFDLFNLTSSPRRSVNVYRRGYDQLHTINRTGITPKMG